MARLDHGDVIVNIGKSEAILLPAEQLPNEEYQVGDRIRAYIAEVKKGSKGPQVYISRTHPGLLKRLFELEVPEIQEGIVEIKSVARDAGTRSKISVVSSDENIDPVGACLGDRGMRVQAINNEIGNEKIDVIEWSADPVIFVSNALSPAKVLSVAINEREKIAQVIVPDQQLSLAIGREGQNARLAAKLTSWKIDIKSKAQSLDIKLGDDFVVTRLKKKKKKQKPAPKFAPKHAQEVMRQSVEPKKDAAQKKKKSKKQSKEVYTGQKFKSALDMDQDFVNPSDGGGVNFFDDDDDD